jgi:dipeptidyl aminopeptidase/acylaminoacyl peptidase
MKRTISLSSFLIFCLSVWAFSQPLLSPDDLKIPVSLSEAEISPDGKKALFIVTRKNFEKNNSESELVLVNLETKKQSTLTKQKGVTEPLWAPDGGRISFLAESDNGLQIFLLPLQGGEAQQITNIKGGILHHTWSPDGTKFAFIAAEVPPEKTGTDKFNNAFEVGSNNYLTTEPPVQNYAGIIEIIKKIPKQISPKGVIVATEFYNSSLSWTPDGNQIAITVYPSSRSGDSDLGKVHLLNLENNTLHPLTEHADQEGPGYFSPDGKQMLFSYPRDGIPANESEVYSVATTSGVSKSLTRSLDREVLEFAWLPDSKILLTGYDGVKSTIWVLDQTGKFTVLDAGEAMEVYEISVSKTGSMAFIGEEKYRPSELFYKATLDAKPVRITEFNQQIAARKQGKREEFKWKSSDGFEPDGILTYPPDFDANQKYPLVLLIHGGPTAASTLAFDMTVQMMAAKGWIVFEPNYRGSNDLGNAFQSAISNDAGEGPGTDVITGVQELKKKLFVDSKKVAVSGWSYGGWMTAWMIGRYPEEWVAAVAGAAPVDYTDMYSLSDLNRMRRHAITDSPYKGENWKSALEQSPIKNFSKIKTPTLILSKIADSRVSITGSYKLFNALRDNDVKTQFIAYPGAGHLVTDPVRTKDVYERWLNWLEQFLSL